MIEFLGAVAKHRKIKVEVVLDSVGVGTLKLDLHQWDRLREHRREGGPSLACGLQIVVEAERDE